MDSIGMAIFALFYFIYRGLVFVLPGITFIYLAYLVIKLFRRRAG